MIFNKCVKLSHIHSDYLKFFYDNTQFSNFKSLNSTILFDIVNKTTQDFISKNNEFNKVSEQQKIQLNNSISSYSNSFLKLNVDEMNPNQMSICDDFINEIYTTLDNTELSDQELLTTVENILFSDNYIYTPDETFYYLSIIAATYLDSISYWNENLYNWVTDTPLALDASWNWRTFWKYVNRIGYADAEAALQCAYIAVLTGPLTLEVVFVSAGVGSVFETGKIIYDTYK